MLYRYSCKQSTHVHKIKIIKSLERERERETQKVPFVLGSRGGRFRLIAKDAKNSKPTGQHLQGAIPLPAFSNHFYHGHDVWVIQGGVEVERLQERKQRLLVKVTTGKGVRGANPLLSRPCCGHTSIRPHPVPL